jgi:hypothetical protein
MKPLSTLTLTAATDRNTVTMGASIPVHLTLTNRSNVPVWVNRRMGLGYEDGIEREVYFTVLDEAGNVLPVPDDARVDVHRMPLQRDDFQLLSPGDGVATDVNLSLWYPFTKAGRYRVVLDYDNTADGKPFGIDAFTGRVTANPLTIEIQ